MPETVVANDLRAQWTEIGGDAARALERVGRSGWFVLGEEVLALEAALQNELGVRFAVGVGNGLDALEIGLRCAGLAPGDRVLTTPLTAFATTLAIVRAGGVPVFVDVDPCGVIDLDAAEGRLRGGGIRFLLPVHLYGHAVDLARLEGLARAHDVIVVEDCAQSILATSHGVRTGSVGAAAATSFYPTKNLGALGDGGALFTNDEAIAARARSLRDYGQTSKYVHGELGVNSRLDELQAAILRTAMLPRLAAWTARRREIARVYRASIDNPGLVVPGVPAGSDSVAHLFPVLAARRDDFLAHLAERRIQGSVHYPHLASNQAALRGVPFEISSSLTHAEAFAASEVSLPIHPFLSDADIARVIDACNSF